MFEVKVEADYFITLPEEIVEKLGLEKGDQLGIDIENGRIIITPIKEP